MEMIIYLIIGIAIGALLGWLIAKTMARSAKEQLERDFIGYRAATEAKAASDGDSLRDKTEQILALTNRVQEYTTTLATVKDELSAANANLQTASQSKEEKAAEHLKMSGVLQVTQNDLNITKENLATLTANHQSVNELWETDKAKLALAETNVEKVKADLAESRQSLATANADLRGAQDIVQAEKENTEGLKLEIRTVNDELNRTKQFLATATAENNALGDKLSTQRKEMEEMGKKFNTEFENIANKILDTKTEKFTELNKTNLTSILEPLGKNLNDFKTKVEEVYDKEAKERFSLGEKVKELAQLNQMISDDARNLTKALKGESKTQGNWGEMILESILERSGLVKDREYFMEHQLTDEDGKPLISSFEGKKMRPDAVIKYPDKRSVIIDSKVSLNAFTRLIAATDLDEQKKELTAHVQAIKAHIVTLSAKGYDDYNHALDFVMLFVPSEPAYIAALQNDPDLWNFAYDKRILLLSPTNLITSLKLIVDLWKREYQNKNAVDIADRGTKLYEKFVGFVTNLTTLGQHLDKAQDKYSEAFKQLSTGADNLVLQADKLKKLGVKTKKSIPEGVLNAALSEELLGEGTIAHQ